MRVPWLHKLAASQDENHDDQTDTEGEETDQEEEEEESEDEENVPGEVTKRESPRPHSPWWGVRRRRME